MMEGERPKRSMYKVIVNEQGQYSIWPADRENLRGWTDEGKTGAREECRAYLREMGWEQVPQPS